jgi:hypothetical protein
MRLGLIGAQKNVAAILLEAEGLDGLFEFARHGFQRRVNSTARR